MAFLTIYTSFHWHPNSPKKIAVMEWVENGIGTEGEETHFNTLLKKGSFTQVPTAAPHAAKKEIAHFVC